MEPKSRWYYENHGKAEGPVSTLELAKKIQDGSLKLIDLVFKEGDGQWMPAEHFSEITSLIKNTGTEFKIDADWVVLRTIEVDGRNQYDQIGPFTIEQVLQLIDKGKVKFTDFVWREGYENWVPLGQLDKYENPLESSVRVDMSIYEKPRIEELAETPKPPKFFKPAQKIKPQPEEAKPVEAVGEDLAAEKWAIETKPAIKKNAPAPEVVEVPAPVAPLVEPRRRRKDDKENLSPEAVEEKEKIETSKKRKEQLATAKQRWSTVGTAVASFAFLCGATLFVFFGHKTYLAQQSKSLKMTFEPTTATAQLPKKKNPEPPPEIAAAKPVPAPPVKEIKKPSEFSQMTTKQKSFFYHNERLFLFYSAQKGVSLVNEVEKILKTPASKKKASRNSQLEAWVAKVQSHHRSVMAESKGERLYPEIYKRLSSVSQQFNERGQDLQSQLRSGRGPSKEWTLKEVSVEYKKLLKLAQDLD